MIQYFLAKDLHFGSLRIAEENSFFFSLKLSGKKFMVKLIADNTLTGDVEGTG